MKESPYWGAKWTANMRQRCALSGLKCREVGFRNTRAPSHQTSPERATNFSAV